MNSSSASPATSCPHGSSTYYYDKIQKRLVRVSANCDPGFATRAVMKVSNQLAAQFESAGLIRFEVCCKASSGSFPVSLS